MSDIVAPAAQFIDASHWGTVDFISDLHLSAQDPKTAHAFFDYLKVTQAQAIFILGDLFEVWIGDDVLEREGADFERQCSLHLAQKAKSCSIYFLPGNRDFLLSDVFFSVSQVQKLHDPCVLQTQNQRFLLTHGDELCLSDHQYQSFRSLVRSPQWISNFLAQPIEQREKSARAMREQSIERQSQFKLNNEPFADLDQAACLQWLIVHNCHCLIHGHTHKPGEHPLENDHLRVVLSDWDAQATPARTQVLRLQGHQLQRMTQDIWVRG
jgi:UDP-2,3-diacylglucosamine hydrolase